MLLSHVSGQPNLPSDIPKRIQSLGEPRPGKAVLFRLPEEKRENCKALYVPRSVCIGPYHRESETKEMKQFKLYFLKDFLGRPGNNSFDAYWTKIKDLEIRALGFYSEIPQIKQIEFLEMLLLDGVFILEVLLKHHEGILVRHMANHIQRNLEVDFILLENQIPFSVLSELFKFLCESNRAIQESYRCWTSQSNLENLAMDFFDLRSPPSNSQQNDEISHLLHLFYRGFITKPISLNILNQESRRIISTIIPSATDLKEHGVNFEKSSDDNFLLVEFKNGTLKLPPMGFDETAKCVFANLVAFEETRSLDKPVTSWSHLFKSLIRNEQDLLIFVRRGVIANLSGNDKEIVEFLCNVCSYTSLNRHNHYLSELYQNVHLYFESKWRRWWTVFKREYFRWPWSIGTFMWSVLIAVFVIVQFYWKAKSENNKGKGNPNWTRPRLSILCCSGNLIPFHFICILWRLVDQWTQTTFVSLCSEILLINIHTIFCILLLLSIAVSGTSTWYFFAMLFHFAGIRENIIMYPSRVGSSRVKSVLFNLFCYLTVPAKKDDSTK